MPAPAPTYYTVEQVLDFPDDGNRYELVYGKLLVSPAPRPLHQKVVMRLAPILWEYCMREDVGELFNVDADLTWGRQDLLTQPDLFVIARENAGWQRWSDIRRVPLVVEILSPSTRQHDRFDKRIAYRDMGVDVYWILDADEKLAEVWTPEAQFPLVERERVTWHPAGASRALVIDLVPLLAE